jgi:hypothetical protein
MKRGVTVAALVWITRRVVGAAKRYLNFMPQPCGDAEPASGCNDCWADRMGYNVSGDPCPESLKDCDHHCDCSWILDHCCWCGVEFTREGTPVSWMGFGKEAP